MCVRLESRPPALRRQCRHRHRITLSFAALSFAALSLCASHTALASEPSAPESFSSDSAPTEVPETNGTDVCVEAHTQSQVLRHEAKLLETRAALLSCSAASCPGAIRHDCSRWLEEVQGQIPSVGFRASVDGVERVDVQVFIDDKLVLERLEGKSMELDPGVSIG